MLKLPLVSVEMITYNHAPYIAQAMDGVLSQKTDFPYELVIGEDCSTDGTREIVLRYAEAHPDVIRVVTSESNVGMRANSRRTTEACRGKYIAWCEGDDYWHRDDKLQLQVDYLENHPECKLVYSDFGFHDVSTGERVSAFNRARGLDPPQNPTLSDLLFGRCGIITCTVCAHLKTIRCVMRSDPYVYDSRRFLMGDTPLWADILAHGRIHYLPESLAMHIILPESASNSQSAVRQHRFIVSNSEMRVYFAHKYGLPADEVRLLETKLHESNLFLAFITCNADLSRTAWRCLDRPTPRHWVLYRGTENRVLNRILRAVWRFKRRHKSNVTHVDRARSSKGKLSQVSNSPVKSMGH